MKPRISIIGANSFLARRIVTYFKNRQTYAFYLYGNSKTEDDYQAGYIPFRIPEFPLDYEALLNSDVILYCAGAGVQSSKKYEAALTYEVNAFEPVRIFLYLEQHGYKGTVITFGSYFEIGNNAENRYFTETDVQSSARAVPNDYCISKRLFTRFLESTAFSFNWYHLILGSVYGRGENESRLIPYIIKSIQQGTEVHLSSGGQIRQYIHVYDIYIAIQGLLDKKPASGIYNLTREDPLTVKQLAELINSILHDQGILNFGTINKSDQPMHVLLLDASKIKKAINWKAEISLKEGIKEYIEQ